MATNSPDYLDWHKRVSWDYRDELSASPSGFEGSTRLGSDSFDPPIDKPVFPEDVPARAEKVPF